MKSVAVIGGGIAGLTVAQELAERGYQVTIYEATRVLGGKARSNAVPGATGGRGPLPGEHGFHFFPGFYQHVTDTMRRIPCQEGGTVYERLVAAKEWMLGAGDAPPALMAPRVPIWPREWRMLAASWRSFRAAGITSADMRWLAARMWQLATSCAERFDVDYEKCTWWEYVDAEARSPAFRSLLARGPMIDFIACRAREANLRTVGLMGLQFSYVMLKPWKSADRVFDRPMNEAWIDPWVAWVAKLGIGVAYETRATGVRCERGSVVGLRVEDRSGAREVVADHYVMTIPPELWVDETGRPTPLVAELIRQDPSLATLPALERTLTWMNGLQLFLKSDLPVCAGHASFLASPWGITLISEAQFWPSIDWPRLGSGEARGVLSIILSDWFRADAANRLPEASAATREQLIEGVIAQINAELADRPKLERSDVESVFFDPGLRFEQGPSGARVVNDTKLLKNSVNTWGMRPDAFTALSNFWLAGDWARTTTLLACAEGANEAGRRAAARILAADGHTGGMPRLFAIYRPLLLAPWRWYDRKRMAAGLPWRASGPWRWLKALFGRP